VDNTPLESTGSGSQPLRGDSRRRANAAIRGFMYQFWRTVEAWIELEPDDLLFVEGAEDFDQVRGDQATAVQVKDTRASGSLTLGNAKTLATLGRFWKLKQDNRGVEVRFKFITTAEPGSEKAGFGGQKAVETWDLCRQSPLSTSSEQVEAIRRFLLQQDSLDDELKLFARAASTDEIKRQLIDPVEWLFSQPPLEGIEDRVVGELVKLGESQGLTVADARTLAQKLYAEVEKAAIAKAPQALTFLQFRELLDRAANVELPRESLRLLRGDVDVIERMLAEAIASGGGSLPQLITAPVAFAPPVPGRHLWRREPLIERVRLALAGGLVYVDGSAGMGKTTLLRQAIEDNGIVLWVELRGQSTREVTDKCRLLTQVVRKGGRGIVVVLDDLNPEDDPREVEQSLSHLAATIREGGGALGITAYRPAGPRLISILGLEQESQINVPHFEETEARAFLSAEGCPEERVHSLGRVIWLNTGGHSQLVAARVNALRTTGFPPADIGDILEQPKEIQDARTEAIATVRSVLSEDARRLLYRLSLAIPYFKRSHALRIGAAGASIGSGGEAFEELVGPWLEQPSPGYYRVSALMSKAAYQMLPQDEVVRLHGDIATALLAEKVMTPNEFGGVVIHALAGAADAQLAIAAKLFLTASSKVKKMLAPEVSWIAGARLEPETVPGLTRGARQFMKLFQFEVAGIVAPERLEAMATSMEKDFTTDTDDLTETLPRMLFLAKRLLQIELPMAPARVVADVLEVERLASMAGEWKASGLRKPYRRVAANATGSKLPAMFSPVLIPRVRTAESIRALAQALDALTERDRKRLLERFKTDDGDLRVLFLGPWVSTKRDDDAAWRDYADALDQALAAGRRWQHYPWMRAAARARSAVLDEMLGRREEAETLVVDVTAEIGTSLSLEDQLAGIAFNHQKNQEALEIWQRILPIWKADTRLRDAQPMFGARHAAVAAARLGQWRMAAELFDQARKRAKHFSMTSWKVGLLADQGYALWRSGDLKAAAKVFRQVTGDLEELPNTPESFAEYAAQKLIGHTLSALSVPGGSLEVRPGMCSDLEPNEAIGQLPPTPRVYMWFWLWHLARKAQDYKVAGECADKLRNTPFAFLRGTAARHDVEHCIRSRKLSGVPEAAERVATAMEATRQRTGMHPGEPDPPGLQGELTDVSVGAYVRPILLAAILRAREIGRDVGALVELWRSMKGTLHPFVANEIDLCLEYSSMGSDQLATVLRNGSETAETRSLAAALLVGRTDTSPENALYAHVTLVDRAKSYDTLKETAGGSMDTLVRRDWLRLCERRFLLREPGIHVGAIRQACTSDAAGWPAAVRIILAAIPATSLEVTESLRVSLRMVAAEEDS
jgi:hypothetical protein